MTSTFQFKDGLILHHNDDLDPVTSANMAMTGPKAWLAGHARPVSALAANKNCRSTSAPNTNGRSPLNAVDTSLRCIRPRGLAPLTCGDPMAPGR